VKSDGGKSEGENRGWGEGAKKPGVPARASYYKANFSLFTPFPILPVPYFASRLNCET
jgi:hypothetical protein